MAERLLLKRKGVLISGLRLSKFCLLRARLISCLRGPIGKCLSGILALSRACYANEHGVFGDAWQGTWTAEMSKVLMNEHIVRCGKGVVHLNCQAV